MKGAFSRCHILNEVDNSLQRHGTDYFDLYLIHIEDRLTPIDEMLRVL